MFDRRKFVKFLGLGGLFGGTAAAAQASPVPPQKSKGGGVIVFYQNVGQLPPHKAQAFIDRITEQLGPLPDGWLHFVLPVRPPQETKVEVFFNDHHNGEAEKIVQKIVNSHILRSKDEKYWNNLKIKAKDGALFLLGAPVRTIELTEENLEACWRQACSWMDDLSLENQKCSIYHHASPPEMLICELTLGFAMYTLGLVRSGSEGADLKKEAKLKIKETKQQAEKRFKNC